ncbi:hypothetical protein ROA7745_02679 [Roseovarius aestuarii]|uniref:Uncharacterized protein n=1 Tax=Roseovarius aestuarii TaxID=475083 RepID=A0A1X7BT93_9RHOB|nr:hypothetical protein ROA7745_02679 [Roseovarius aestuarii]
MLSSELTLTRFLVDADLRSQCQMTPIERVYPGEGL